MTTSRPDRREAGFSLLELAVVLVVSSVLAVVVLSLLPLGPRLVEEEHAQARLEAADAALAGFLRVHLRLPTADVDGDGLEDGGHQPGLLPVATLGLDATSRLGYMPDPALLLAPSPGLYRPPLPTGHAPPADPNGLDLCVHLGQRLRSAAPAPGLPAAAGYVLVHGLGDGGGAVAALDDFQVPNDPAALHPALQRQAAGFGELYSRLGCPDRLGRAFAAAQAAVSAQSAVRLAELQRDFRVFDVEVAELELQNAKTGLAFSEFDMAIGILDVAMAAVQVIMDIPPDDAFEAAVAGIELAAATVQLGFLIAEVIEARHGGIDETEEALRETRDRSAEAEAEVLRMIALRQAAARTAVELDQGSLMR